jgi:hypothetical protein
MYKSKEEHEDSTFILQELSQQESSGMGNKVGGSGSGF